MPQYFPDLPPLVPQRGTAFSRTLCRKLFLGQGWTVVGEIPNLPKAVAIISPHTSNIDGWYGFLAIGGLGLKITVLGKDTLTTISKIKTFIVAEANTLMTVFQ